MMQTKNYLAPEIKKIFLVGCGGTGSYLAEGLASMIAGYRMDISLTLVDFDVVEDKNVYRQLFMPFDVAEAKYKSEALSEMLNIRFGLNTSFSTEKIEEPCSGNRETLIITCVDKVSVRKLFKDSFLWLDLGNDRTSGQAIFGTTSRPEVVQEQKRFWKKLPYVRALPNVYLRAGLEQLEDASTVPSCADTPFTEQGPLVNRWAAGVGLGIIEQLLVQGEVRTPCSYFDTMAGVVAPIRITKDYLN